MLFFYAKNQKKRRVERMRNLFEKAKRYGWKVIAAVVALVTTYAPAVYAAESADEVAKQVTSPLNSLADVMTSIMAVVGVLMLIKSVTELVNAIQQQDNSGIFHAGRGIAAALLMISIKVLVKLFGV
jgi:TRAP-type C4-dicarboxylate transport system permease small subunit